MTKDNDSDIDRAENRELMGLLEQAAFALEECTEWNNQQIFLTAGKLIQEFMQIDWRTGRRREAASKSNGVVCIYPLEFVFLSTKPSPSSRCAVTIGPQDSMDKSPQNLDSYRQCLCNLYHNNCHNS